VEQRVQATSEVWHREVLRVIQSSSAARVHIDASFVQWGCPESSIGFNAGIEIMDLLTRLVKHV
jgi:hypothetical protein